MKLCSRNHPQTPENTRTTRHAISGVVYVTCVACVREKKLEAKKMQRARRRGGTPAPAPHLEWPAERIEQLRGLWAQSELSTAAIARSMKTTKNAIVGKAHRLGLPGRPSPIIRGGPKAPQQPHSAARAAAAAGVIAGLVSGLPAPVMAMPRGPSDRVRTSVRTTQPVPEPPRMARGPCCWLDGERGAYRRCDSPAVRGSYCERHGSLAYQPKQPSREMSHAV